MKSIDSFRPPVRKVPPTQRPVQADEPQGTGARFTKLPNVKKRRQIPWLLIASVLASPLLFGLAWIGLYGVAILVVYGIVVLVLKWSSSGTFALAVMALLYMVGAQLAVAGSLARGLAVLAYVLLAIGAISLALELKSARRVWFKKR
ncbi:MAG TPA: hypothetical protein VJM46_05275 [Candidatus Saccharimonadales bacterium]|nr:hypothetical protein [Candidatus Saccharimonadales bacterium]